MEENGRDGVEGDSHLMPVREKLGFMTSVGTVRTPLWRLI